MNNMLIAYPSHHTPCLIHLKHLGWIEAEMYIEEDIGCMYYPHNGLNTMKCEVWYSHVTDSNYETEDVDFWVYLHEIQQIGSGG